MKIKDFPWFQVIILVLVLASFTGGYFVSVYEGNRQVIRLENQILELEEKLIQQEIYYQDLFEVECGDKKTILENIEPFLPIINNLLWGIIRNK